MSKALLWIFGVTALLYGGSGDIGFVHTFSLKKDQIAEAAIIKDTPVSFEKEGNLTFRWTLYKNKRLVLLVDYEGFKRQHILRTRYGLNSIRIYVSGDYEKISKRDFIVLRFVSYDEKSERVKLDMEYVDLSKRFEIKVLRPKK